ncbi:hypothetical protein DASC09_025370 [Saccharomycopsis crataegensis]|uniref:2-deoxy-D-gluconate 3-dehydrogenase n=1 Tax=Saccharomycopsis crataegensis TaxID=43959 RepID=A0AAV5QKY7_9ASCO|nr:hypothetical protein DASC09_025370 [Saccharomycopsis crataegensis]
MSNSIFSTQGKVVLATGATSGIGLGMCKGLAEFGCQQLILIHRPSTSPAEATAELKKISPLGDKLVVSYIQADVAEVNVEDIEEKIVKPALELSVTGKIDVLINNAGVNLRYTAEDFPEDQFQKVLQIDLLFPSKLTRLVGKHMLENNVRGKIIFTLSLISFQGGILSAPYAISKSGLKGFVQALSNEWSSKGINVNGIAPGYIETKLVKSLKEDPVRGRQITERIPIGRWGTPEDFRGPAAFLASSASDYVTGETLLVDGGWMAR